jgi:hypothetical protein
MKCRNGTIPDYCPNQFNRGFVSMGNAF